MSQVEFDGLRGHRSTFLMCSLMIVAANCYVPEGTE
jgi:hypothetical protein